jgi:hypothetical protein
MLERALDPRNPRRAVSTNRRNRLMAPRVETSPHELSHFRLSRLELTPRTHVLESNGPIIEQDSTMNRAIDLTTSSCAEIP